LLCAVEWLKRTKKTMICSMQPTDIKSTTHRPACETAAAGQGYIDGVKEGHVNKTGMDGLKVGGGKHGSGALGGCRGWVGYLRSGAQYRPSHVGPEVFAAHLPTGGLLYLNASHSRNLAVKLVFRRQAPVRDCAWRHPEPDGKLGAATNNGRRFFYHVLS
jgi:hypothetical protein